MRTWEWLLLFILTLMLSACIVFQRPRVAWPQANDACIHGMCIQHPCQLEEIGRISSRIDIWTFIFCQVVVDWSFKIPALINLIPFLGDSHFSLDWGDLQVGQTPQGPVHFVVINVGGFGYPIGQKDSNSSPADRTYRNCVNKRQYARCSVDFVPMPDTCACMRKTGMKWKWRQLLG